MATGTLRVSPVPSGLDSVFMKHGVPRGSGSNPKRTPFPVYKRTRVSTYFLPLLLRIPPTLPLPSLVMVPRLQDSKRVGAWV